MQFELRWKQQPAGVRFPQTELPDTERAELVSFRGPSPTVVTFVLIFSNNINFRDPEISLYRVPELGSPLWG